MTLTRGPLLLLLLWAGPLAGQTVLTGTVRQDSTGRPLPGVEVLLVGSLIRAVTDAQGRYAINRVPPGRRLALFRSVGFRPVQEWIVLGTEDTVWVNAMMMPQTVELDPLVVTARPAAPRGMGVEAFDQRRKLGFGKFIDSTTLRRSEDVPLIDLIGRLQGIGFGRFPGEFGSIVAVSRRRFGPKGEPCYMAVILDGVTLYASVAPSEGGAGGPAVRPPTDLKLFSTSSIEAVELYRSAAEVPIEFGGAGSACGALVLWTRRP